jgi:hypothetical protein
VVAPLTFVREGRQVTKLARPDDPEAAMVLSDGVHYIDAVLPPDALAKLAEYVSHPRLRCYAPCSCEKGGVL